MAESPIGRWGNIPDPVREPFGAINNDVRYLHYRWAIYKQLFRGGQRRIELLVYIAGEVFFQLHIALLDAVILGVVKLLDRAESGGRDNMSLAYLFEKVREAGAVDLADKLEIERVAAREGAAALLRHRDKRIAHADAAHHPSVAQSALPPIEEAEIEAAIEKIASMMNAVEGRFGDSQTAYPFFIAPSEGDTLIYALRKSADWDVMAEGGLFVGWERLTKDRFADAG